MTLGEHRQALLDDLSIETGDSFYDSSTDYAMLDRFINRAVKFIANMYNWEETQRAVKRDSEANQPYYNYPENWKTDSLDYVTVDGKKYRKIQFREWQEYTEEYPNDTGNRIFADYRKRYFLHPAPTTDGDKNIKLWGHEIPDTLSNTSDEHPFSGQSLLEEAIHLYALGLALRKARGSFFEKGRQLQLEATQLAQLAYDNQLADQADYKSETAEAFEHYDYLGIEGQTRRGSFRTCND